MIQCNIFLAMLSYRPRTESKRAP